MTTRLALGLALALIGGGAWAQSPESAPSASQGDFDHAACLLDLALAGVAYAVAQPVTDAETPECGIARPVEVKAVQPGVAIEAGAIMGCPTARQLALWTRDFVLPAVLRLPDAPRLSGYAPGSVYQCRARVGGDSDKISEHALGTAFDIMAFLFADGSRLEVQPRDGDGDLAEAFQRSVRGSACLFFTTVIGPGTNAAHADHLHLDLAERNGGFRLCE